MNSYANTVQVHNCGRDTPFKIQMDVEKYFCYQAITENKIADDLVLRHEIMYMQASCYLILKRIPVEDNQWDLTYSGNYIPGSDRALYYRFNAIHSKWFIIYS